MPAVVYFLRELVAALIPPAPENNCTAHTLDEMPTDCVLYLSENHTLLY